MLVEQSARYRMMTTTALSRLLGAVAPVALCIAAGPGNGDSASAHETTRASTAATSRCMPIRSAVETDWGSTNAWRPLAPYPVPREATPTRTVGVWLERWTLPGGNVELRRVSAEQTSVARFDLDACTPRITTSVRTYDSAAIAAGFTDQSLRESIAQHDRGMIYVWSPGMPLSVDGIQEARAAANALGIAFTAVVADAGDDDPALRHVAAADARAMESLELVYRNAAVHYPAVVLYRSGAMVDAVIPGYRNRETYRTMIRALFDAHIDRSSRSPRDAAPAMWVDHNARVSTRSSVDTPRDIGFFFKPVRGTTLVSYTSNDRAYLFDLATRIETRVPGYVDPVPTPDGRFLTRPGLIVYPIPRLVRGDTTSVYSDPLLPDEYQTASILRESRSTIRYRVVTGWRDNARFRDYDVTLGTSPATARFQPVGTPFVPCAGRTLTLPISAKTGREFGAFDVTRGTNGVIEVLENGTCADRLDLGFASGKLSFSYDGKSIAFSTSRINVDTAGPLRKPSDTFYKDALVLYRANGRIVSLTRNRPIRGMSFPEFLADGSIMLLDQRSRDRPFGVLRVVDVK